MRPTPSSITTRGPRRSIRRPREGLRTAETRKPKENAPAVTPRSQPNSSRIGGHSSEKAVGALTPTAIVKQGKPTSSQPLKNGTRTSLTTKLSGHRGSHGLQLKHVFRVYQDFYDDLHPIG